MSDISQIRIIEAMKPTCFFIYHEFKRTGRPVSNRDVIAFIVERAPAHLAQKILDVAVQANLLWRHADPKHGITYTPRIQKKDQAPKQAPRPESDEELFGP